MSQQPHPPPSQANLEMNTQPATLATESPLPSDEQFKLEAVSPAETAPESGECFFWKLPPELRTVIYDMALYDYPFEIKGITEMLVANALESAEEDEWEDDEDDTDDAVEGDTTENYDEQDVGNDEDEDAEVENESIENESEGAAEARDKDWEDGYGDNSEVHENEQDEDDESGDVIEAADNNSSEELADATTKAEPEDTAFPRIVRPPLLNVCKLVRQEAAPIYIENLKTSTLGAFTDIQDYIVGQRDLYRQVQTIAATSPFHVIIMDQMRRTLRKQISSAAGDMSLRMMTAIFEAEGLDKALDRTLKVQELMKPVCEAMAEFKDVCVEVVREMNE